MPARVRRPDVARGSADRTPLGTAVSRRAAAWRSASSLASCSVAANLRGWTGPVLGVKWRFAVS